MIVYRPGEEERPEKGRGGEKEKRDGAKRKAGRLLRSGEILPPREIDRCPAMMVSPLPMRFVLLTGISERYSEDMEIEGP